VVSFAIESRLLRIANYRQIAGCGTFSSSPEQPVEPKLRRMTMTKNTVSSFACAIAALILTTLSFAEVTTVQSVDFEYDHSAQTSLYA